MNASATSISSLAVLGKNPWYCDNLVIIVAFVQDNATMSSIRYFEIMYCILCKTEGSRSY